MLEDVQKILTSKKERFPEEGWNRLKELSRKFEAGEITQSAFEGRVLGVADFYDNIKPQEQWWDSSDDRSLFFRPYIIGPENAKDWGIDLTKKPKAILGKGVEWQT